MNPDAKAGSLQNAYLHTMAASAAGGGPALIARPRGVISGGGGVSARCREQYENESFANLDSCILKGRWLAGG